MPEKMFECDNCFKKWGEGDLVVPAPHLEQRVGPGEFMPAGECPDCGAFCHEVGKWDILLTVYMDTGGNIQFHGGTRENTFRETLKDAGVRLEDVTILRRFFIHGRITDELVDRRRRHRPGRGTGHPAVSGARTERSAVIGPGGGSGPTRR